MRKGFGVERAMTKPLRILQVGTGATSIPPVGAYGIERAIHTLSSTLQGLGHDVTLLDVADPERPSVPYEVIPIAASPWEEKDSLMSRAPRVFRFSLLAVRKVRQLLRSGAFDVVHCHFQFPGGLVVPAMRGSGTPAVYSVHNFIWSDLELYKSTLRKALPSLNVRAWLWLQMERRAIRAARAVTCQTDPIARNVAAEFHLQPDRMDVIPHGLGDDWFEPIVGGGDDFPWLNPEDSLVLNVARIVPVKNQKVLARAAAQVAAEVPSVRFVFVGPQGDSFYAQEVRDILNRSGAAERAIFLSNLSERELRNLYERSHLFVLPSTAESSPASLLEAMASRTPVIGSDIDTLRWMVPEKCGVLLPPGDECAWAETIVRLLRDDGKRKELAEEAWHHAYANHRWTAITSRLIELYERVGSVTAC